MDYNQSWQGTTEVRFSVCFCCTQLNFSQCLRKEGYVYLADTVIFLINQLNEKIEVSETMTKAHFTVVVLYLLIRNGDMNVTAMYMIAFTVTL